jgi:hypothetical protein
MALIPYEHIPAPHDPPITVAGQPLQEFYCGDARCDCATAHVLFGGVPRTVDLGTVNVEPIQQQGQQQVTPAQQVLAQTLRQALSAGPIATLRDHYAKVREFGREQHFRYVDWSGLKQGDLVAWEQVFRTESAPMWTMTPAARRMPSKRRPARRKGSSLASAIRTASSRAATARRSCGRC